MRIDRRESLYDELVREETSACSLLEREAALASVNLGLTCDVHQSYLFKRLVQYGLSRSSFNMLALLRHGYPKGLQLSEIGELLITSRANITGLVDHLEQKGYVIRVVDANDRRARLAKLTRKGEALIDEIMPSHIDRCISFFSNLRADEVQQLTVLLKKLRHSPEIAESQEEDVVIFNSILSVED